jgi:GH25 family lysozyme M1 (1,4-beta-N-acetylmuramidase)
MVMEVMGIDVSRHQNKGDNPVGIDWGIAKARGVIFGVARATVGNYYTDPTFRFNWDGMKKNGIYRTAYHVVRPDYPADEQIDRLFTALDGERSDLPLILDVEVVGAGSGPFYSKDVNSCVQKCAGYIKQQDGREPIIYSAGWYVNNYMGSKADREYLARFKFWVAQYNSYIDIPDPVYPWNDNWTFWQWSADGNARGKEFGAESRDIDINRYNGTFKQFRIEFKLEEQEEPEPPQPEPELTTAEKISAMYDGMKKKGWLD